LAFILCPTCKFKTLDGYILCKHCGNPLSGALQIPQLLVLKHKSGPEPTGGLNILSPLLLKQGVTSIGRMGDNTIILTEPLISRHHAVIHRDQDGSYLVEDLESTNGTFLNGSRLKTVASLNPGDLLKIGDTLMYLDEGPKLVFNPSGTPLSPEATIISLPEKSISTTTSSFELTENTPWSGEVVTENYRPQACEGWALKKLLEKDRSGYFVLKGLENQGYIRLSERDIFMWKLMDGQHTMRDILVAYFQEYSAIGANRLIDLLNELNDKGFLKVAKPIQQSQPRGVITISLSFIRRVVGAFYQKQFSIQGVDEWITRIYTRIGWILFTRTGQLALAAIALTGLAAFVMILLRGGKSMFVVQGSTTLGIVVMALVSVISIFLHENAHALTVKSYNRQVNRVGFMIYFGMPAFFVNTSDIWMETKGPRLQTSLAGPYSNLLIGSATSLIMLANQSALLNDLLFQLAAWSYISVFINLNPLLELDGYYILVDWLGIPLLRKRSLDFVQKRLWKKLRGGDAFSRNEKLFTVYGVLSVLWGAVVFGIFFLSQGQRILTIF